MKNLVIFLNELSLEFANDLSQQEMLQRVLATVDALRATRRLRKDLVVAGHIALAGAMFRGGTQPLAAILRGDLYKEEWRFLQSLDQSSPWDAYPGMRRPGELQEVSFRGSPAFGLLWAEQNDTAVVSFAFNPAWALTAFKLS